MNETRHHLTKNEKKAGGSRCAQSCHSYFRARLHHRYGRAGTRSRIQSCRGTSFGYTRARAIGRELADLIIPPELRERHRRGIAHYLATGEGPVLNRRIEIAAVRADGVEILVELAITALHLGGAPVFTAYLRDITERVRTERRRAAQYSIVSLLAGAWSIAEAGEQILRIVASSGTWILVLSGFMKKRIIGFIALVPGTRGTTNSNFSTKSQGKRG